MLAANCSPKMLRHLESEHQVCHKPKLQISCLCQTMMPNCLWLNFSDPACRNLNHSELGSLTSISPMALPSHIGCVYFGLYGSVSITSQCPDHFQPSYWPTLGCSASLVSSSVICLFTPRSTGSLKVSVLAAALAFAVAILSLMRHAWHPHSGTCMPSSEPVPSELYDETSAPWTRIVPKTAVVQKQ